MKTKVLFLASLAILSAASLKAQLNLGATTAPDASAILQATSTSKGFLSPAMSTANRGADNQLMAAQSADVKEMKTAKAEMRKELKTMAVAKLASGNLATK